MPTECPEEEYDPRTLYERLKEQRDKKQEDFEESRKLKHCIKVLDNDEVEFLSKVDEQKLKEMLEKQEEEKQAIEEFRKQVADQTQVEQEKKIGEFTRSLFSKQSPSSSKDATNQLARTTRRQAKLLQNAVKRKASEDEDQPAKRQKDDDSREDGQGGSGEKEDKKEDEKDEKDNDEKDEKNDDDASGAKRAVVIEQEQPTAFKVLGVLPGLASYYSDSSNSAYDSDESGEQVNSSELAPLFLSKQTRDIVRLNKTIKKHRQ